VETTYLLHLWAILVLTMVRSWSHHLRHQWPQINTFASLNHIHHHTYFKSPYVHIQVFHILHHHTMKLLQAFKSFLPGGSIVENRQRNWFATGHTIQHRKLILCRPYSSTVKTGLLQAAQFGSENCFAAGTTISEANATSLQPTHFRQRMLICCRQLDFDSESHFCCRQHNFGSKT
jgi:hypothetical protein